MPKRTSSKKREADRRRQAARRERQRAGIVNFRLWLPKVEIRDSLLDASEIGEWDDENHVAQEQAISRILLQKLANVTRDRSQKSGVLYSRANESHETDEVNDAGKPDPTSRKA
jgi:hypothetical protein